MFYICYDCRKFYSLVFSHCPECGRQVFTTNNSRDLLERTGYAYMDFSSGNNSGNECANSSNAAYTNNNNSRESANHSDNNSGNGDFFAQYNSGYINSDYNNSGYNNYENGISDYGNTSNNYPPLSNDYQDSAWNTNQDARQREAVERRAEEERRRRRSATRHQAFLNFFASLNWRVVFTISLIVIVIVAGLVIWNMRYIILQSIMNFLIALLPLIIVIGIIVGFFKSLFK